MRPPFSRIALALLLLACALPLAPANAAAAGDPADPAFWYSTAADGSPRVKLYFFWTSRCQHCRAARPFLESLPEKLPYVDLVSLPTEGNATNARLRYTVSRALGADPVAVPGIFFCGQAQIGYDDAQGIGASIVQRLADCRARLAADPGLASRPVPVIPPEQRGTDGGPGTTVAIVVGLAFVGLIVAGVVLSRRAAAAKARALAAKQAARGGERRRRR